MWVFILSTLATLIAYSLKRVFDNASNLFDRKSEYAEVSKWNILKTGLVSFLGLIAAGAFGYYVTYHALLVIPFVNLLPDTVLQGFGILAGITFVPANFMTRTLDAYKVFSNKEPLLSDLPTTEAKSAMAIHTAVGIMSAIGFGIVAYISGMTLFGLFGLDSIPVLPYVLCGGFMVSMAILEYGFSVRPMLESARKYWRDERDEQFDVAVDYACETDPLINSQRPVPTVSVCNSIIQTNELSLKPSRFLDGGNVTVSESQEVREEIGYMR